MADAEQVIADALHDCRIDPCWTPGDGRTCRHRAEAEDNATLAVTALRRAGLLVERGEISVPVEALRTWMSLSSVNIQAYDKEPWTKRKILAALDTLNDCLARLGSAGSTDG